MVLGRTHSEGSWLGVGLGLGILASVVLFHVAASYYSRTARHRVHVFLAALVDPIRENLLHRLISVQECSEKDISPERRVVKPQAVSSVAPSSIRPVVGSSEDPVSAAASSLVVQTSPDGSDGPPTEVTPPPLSPVAANARHRRSLRGLPLLLGGR